MNQQLETTNLELANCEKCQTLYHLQALDLPRVVHKVSDSANTFDNRLPQSLGQVATKFSEPCRLTGVGGQKKGYGFLIPSLIGGQGQDCVQSTLPCFQMPFQLYTSIRE